MTIKGNTLKVASIIHYVYSFTLILKQDKSINTSKSEKSFRFCNSGNFKNRA